MIGRILSKVKNLFTTEDIWQRKVKCPVCGWYQYWHYLNEHIRDEHG